MTPRIIHKSAARARNEARELLEMIFCAEMLAPSRCLWVVSAWLRDVPVLDNRSGAYASLGNDLPLSELLLSRVLSELAEKGTHLVIATRPGEESVGHAVQARAGKARVRVVTQEVLHTKGIVGDHFAFVGSMNITANGIEHLTELIQFSTDSALVGKLQVEFRQHYGERGT